MALSLLSTFTSRMDLLWQQPSARIHYSPVGLIQYGRLVVSSCSWFTPPSAVQEPICIPSTPIPIVAATMNHGLISFRLSSLTWRLRLMRAWLSLNLCPKLHRWNCASGKFSPWFSDFFVDFIILDTSWLCWALARIASISETNILWF